MGLGLPEVAAAEAERACETGDELCGRSRATEAMMRWRERRVELF